MSTEKKGAKTSEDLAASTEKPTPIANGAVNSSSDKTEASSNLGILSEKLQLIDCCFVYTFRSIGEITIKE